MRSVVRFENTYHTIFASPGVQLILSSYCKLLQWDHDDLTAPYWRLYWNDTSGAAIRAGGVDIALRPNRVVLIPPGTAFSTETRRPVGHLHLHFVTGSPPSDDQRRPIEQAVSGGQRALLLRLRDQLKSPTASRARHIADYLSHAVVTGQLAALPDAFWQSSAPDGDIRRILAVMHERPASVDVRSLPRTIAVSPNTLVRRFRRVTGTTPAAYLIRLRLDDAAVDLRTHDESVEAIARRHGFCDRFHLSKAFKKAFGIGPAAYRAGCRNF